uniref:non-specific serine/threonine protein kinase n=1 Tax=Xenopsylla cheopis TaxID=163159 RepID=A0A6M2DRW0_XENCH
MRNRHQIVLDVKKFNDTDKNKTHLVVAIKSITKKSLAKSQNLLGKEIKILKELTELHHENVVALLDCKESAHNVYLVMEYCNGGDLADYLSAKGTLSEDTIRLFLCQLAGAMRALHAKGIVHRDLKPQNILLAHTGSRGRTRPENITLKIADFGFARFLQDGVMAATLCGSPMYMAPEVIMSLQYDAKADLWSLGTIVFQCLTGKAPFQAHTPQELKMFYEKNANLSPKIPVGTSPELSDLLRSLLRRNACDRISFDTFFSHSFLQRPDPQTDLPGELPAPLGTLCTPPSATIPIPIKVSPVIQDHLKNDNSDNSPTDSRNSQAESESSSPEETDDFVLVPKNLPSTDVHIDFSDRTRYRMVEPTIISGSPPRPSSLPISEPRPVPSATNRMTCPRNINQAQDPNGPVVSAIPRSQPITMKRSEHRSSQPDISSISPPSVQFVIGTPPGGGRRRSTSGGALSETPPPTNTWQVTPPGSTVHWQMSPKMPHHPTNTSPLRRSGTSSPILSALPKMTSLGSPGLDNNNPPRFGMGPRAITLPETMQAAAQCTPSILDIANQEPITFLAPELPEETLLEREHNETLAKLNFVLALSDCVLELAATRGAPLSSLLEPSHVASSGNRSAVEARRWVVDETGSVGNSQRAEQLVLLIRALHLLSSGLNLATKQLKDGQLQPSATVKNVLSMMNNKYKTTLAESKRLNNSGLLQKASTTNITADKILYNHAIEMCQSAALDELFGNPEECFQRYQTAQILLHSLSQHVSHQQDRILLTKYKDAVEKRLYILQQKGYIYATEDLT